MPYRFKVAATRESTTVMSKQRQAAGDDSEQYQAGRDIVFQGVSAADVHSIITAEIVRVRDELTAQARQVAEERLERFGERLFTNLSSRNLLAAFADPDFQFALHDASRAAVTNDEEHTEQLLIDLLANRAEHGNSPRVRLVTQQALKAADQLSGDALDGLTALWVSFHIAPGDDITDPVRRIADFATTLDPFFQRLPAGGGWLQDLDVLGLVRLSGGFSTIRPFREVVLARSPQLQAAGVEKSAIADALQELAFQGIDESVLFEPHPLRDATLIMRSGTSEEAFEQLRLAGGDPDGRAQLRDAITAYPYGGVDSSLNEQVDAVLYAHASMRSFRDWWRGLEAIAFTPVGDTVAFLNARRFMKIGGPSTVAELLDLRG